MKQILKFNTRSTRLWFTSDYHAYHNRDFVFGARGCSSAEEYVEFIIEEHNRVVAPEDLVVNLGDFTLNADVDKTKALFRRLNGNQLYVWGNHESSTRKIYEEEVLRQHGRTDIEVYPMYWPKDAQTSVCFVGCDLNLVVDGIPIVCSHFAKDVWDKSHYGAWHVCGHSHGSHLKCNQHYPNGKRLDVGVDNFVRPLSFGELEAIMASKTLHAEDRHGQ